MNSFFYSDAGSRETNQDAVLSKVAGKNTILIVADGLGGLYNGAWASSIAVKEIEKRLVEQDVSESAMIEAIEAANTEILHQQEPECPMCSTVAVLWTDGVTALVGTAGDSRIYQFRETKIIYQTRDHSVSQLAVIVGQIKPEEIRKHPDRNKLLRVLGGDKAVRPDIDRLYIKKGDRFLLCTDGFWSAISESEMQTIYKQTTSAKQWLQEMREKATIACAAHGDNNSAVVLEV